MSIMSAFVFFTNTIVFVAILFGEFEAPPHSAKVNRFIFGTCVFVCAMFNRSLERPAEKKITQKIAYCGFSFNRELAF